MLVNVKCKNKQQQGWAAQLPIEPPTLTHESKVHLCQKRIEIAPFVVSGAVGVGVVVAAVGGAAVVVVGAVVVVVVAVVVAVAAAAIVVASVVAQ